MITREQVADLQPGDVVEITSDHWAGASIRGPLVLSPSGGLRVGDVGATTGSGFFVRHADGSLGLWANSRTLRVISRAPRAPRPLYVNHDRARSVPGDVANPGDGSLSVAFRTVDRWIWPNGTRARVADYGLTLLVDGETGRVVA